MVNVAAHIFVLVFHFKCYRNAICIRRFCLALFVASLPGFHRLRERLRNVDVYTYEKCVRYFRVLVLMLTLLSHRYGYNNK